MDVRSDQEQWTHAEIVLAARQALLAEVAAEHSSLGRDFLRLPVNDRVRASGVRASLAKLASDRLSQRGYPLRYAAYDEARDAVVLHAPAELPVGPGLSATVRAVAALRLAAWVALAGCETGIPDHVPLNPTDLRELGEKLRQNPPTYEGWILLQQRDLDRAFRSDPPLVTDKKEVYRRLKAACSHALDRQVLDQLGRQNPGFIDYLQCFPVARAVRRKVIAWLGPTNSGKTHRAIFELSRASSGMYLGPLRLLALEQRDRLAEMGCPCSLITGEERDELSPTHSARTVEMADFSHRHAVCVLDEMQLALDRDRGWAWVAAYCGVAADLLVVTGPVSSEPVIRRLAALCGDELDVHRLERQGQLAFEGVLDWRHVPPRSAVIGFSRAMVLELKAMFESRGLRVSILYGGLSPEVRRKEARRFREGESDIVCATDAIGMGLNLPLDRVIFYETDKFDGEMVRSLTPAEILQIGGRAGRGPGSRGVGRGVLDEGRATDPGGDEPAPGDA